ncbi:hypothetical protein CsatA_011693 [Cannabis sativa]
MWVLKLDMRYEQLLVVEMGNLGSYIAEHVVGTGSFGVVFQAKSKPETLLPSRKFFKTSATRTGNCRLCKCWIILISSH